MIVRYHQDGPDQDNMGEWNWRGIDVVSAHERDPARYISGLREAVEAAAPLVVHADPLAALGEAMDAARDTPEGFVKGSMSWP